MSYPKHNYVAPNSILGPLTDEILEAQADLQVALGIHRVCCDPAFSTEHDEKHNKYIEDDLARALARLHSLLDALGTPMVNAATHPDIPAKL